MEEGQILNLFPKSDIVVLTIKMKKQCEVVDVG